MKMVIKIIKDEFVFITNAALQTGSNEIPVLIDNPLKHHLYRIAFNDVFQNIENGKVTLPEFTNHENHVIIKVEISQMGKVVKVIESDSYPIRKTIIGNVLVEQFPLGLEKIINNNLEFQKDVLKILKEFEERVLQIENEGEIV